MDSKHQIWAERINREPLDTEVFTDSGMKLLGFLQFLKVKKLIQLTNGTVIASDAIETETRLISDTQTTL